MANALYPKFKEQLLNKEHAFLTDAVKATLIDAQGQGTPYSFNVAHVSYATDVPAGAKVAVSPNLTAPTIALGVFDTADFTWTAVSGPQAENIVLWNDGPTAPTADPLCTFYDTGMTGMPVTPNGGNINVTVNASGWFAL